MDSYYHNIYEMVCRVPEGKVATYGQIARLTGHPRHARQVGYALAALPDEHEVPWYRIVNAQGEISTRTKFGYQDYQRTLLEAEGVEFNEHGRIYLHQFLWEV